MSFLAELRRRNVIRMAGLYLVGASLVTQVADTVVLPMFGAPNWLPRSIVHMVAQDPRFALLLEEMGLPG